MLYRFDAVTAQDVNTFARLSQTSIDHVVAEATAKRIGFESDGVTGVTKHSRGPTIL